MAVLEVCVYQNVPVTFSILRQAQDRYSSKNGIKYGKSLRLGIKKAEMLRGYEIFPLRYIEVEITNPI